MEAHHALSRIPWDRVIYQETVKSLTANEVTQSNAVAEECVASTVTVDISRSVLPSCYGYYGSQTPFQTRDKLSKVCCVDFSFCCSVRCKELLLYCTL